MLGVPSSPAPGTPRALDLRYRLFMAGTGLVDLLFTGAYLVVAGLGTAPYAVLALNLAVFMALNATMEPSGDRIGTLRGEGLLIP